MKKLIIAAAVIAAGIVYAEEAEKAELVEKTDAPIVWGFGNYGIYSGYQLYGNLVNSEPTMQGYGEINFNIPANLGYVGVGLWSNTDLTGKRKGDYQRAFNEYDPNIHYGKTFFFDDECQWGLDYRATVVWFIYPKRHNRPKTHTTMDFDHSLALINPYVVPFIDIVHEYHENNADLLQFGLKRSWNITEKFSVTPSVTFVYRDHRYNWCFPTAGFQEFHGSGLATMKWQIDATYQITQNIGLFAKVAYCSILDHSLRRAAEHGHGANYSQYKDFAWGGMGIAFNF